MKNYLYLFKVLTLLCLFSCKKNHSLLPLNQAEFFFDDQLSSISTDFTHSIWIGSENGKVFKFSNYEVKKFNLADDRIYKVSSISYKSDTLLLVASRNNGLEVWKNTKSKNLIKIKTYTIHNKGYQYSPYDYIMDKDSLFVATSFGLYKTSLKSDFIDMKPVITLTYGTQNKNNHLLIIHNICIYRDSLILGSTSQGLVSYNRNKNSYTYLIKNKTIEYVSVFRDTLYALSGNYLYSKSYDQKNWKKKQVKENSKVFIKNTDTLSTLLSSHHFTLTYRSEKFSIQNLDGFPLSYEGRNICITDSLQKLIYVISKNALWKIPFNYNLKYKNENKRIITSFQNSSFSYFLTSQNDLYCLKNNSLKAYWVCTLDQNQSIAGIDVIGNYLYYYTDKNEVYRIKIKLKSFYPLAKSEFIFKCPSRIISTFSSSENLTDFTYLIGTQSGLYYLNKDFQIKKQYSAESLYITAFYKLNKNVYFSTLNNGIYLYSDTLKKISHTRDYPSIKDFILKNINNKEFIILTNKHIIYKKFKFPVYSLNINKLKPVNDSMFLAISNKGIYPFYIHQDSFQIKSPGFQNLSIYNSLVQSNDILLCTESGVLKINSDNLKKYEEIHLNKINYWSLFITFCFFFCFIFYTIYKTVYLKNIKLECRVQKLKDLIIDLPDLIKNSDLEILDIYWNIQQNLSITDKKKPKNQKNFYTKQINSIYSLFILILLKQKKQLKEINSFESLKMISKSEEIQNTGDCYKLKICIDTNYLWINDFYKLKNEITEIIRLINSGIIIEGYTDVLLNHMENMYKSMYDEKIAVLRFKKDHLISDFVKDNNTNIYSHIHLKKEIMLIRETLEKYTLYNSYTDSMRVSLAKYSQLSDYGHEIWKILKDLKEIKVQTQILLILNTVFNLCLKYKSNIDILMKENTLNSNTSIVNTLYSETQNKNFILSREIDELLSTFFKSLPKDEFNLITEVLKINNFKSQNAKILVLLLSDKHIKRTIIPGILNVYSNLNPIISRLLNNRIKNNINAIEEFELSHPNSLIAKILKSLCK